MGVLIVIVAISSCTSQPVANSTYTDGVITFQYPADFKNATPQSAVISGSKDWIQDLSLANSNNIGINLYKNTNISNSETVNGIGQATVTNFKQVSSTNIISSARVTNPKGVELWVIKYTFTDPSTSNMDYAEAGFCIIKGSAYEIVAVGANNSKSDVQQTAQTIFNSISG